jgi:UDP-N-acetyl-D-glucosamine dehydrogenase
MKGKPYSKDLLRHADAVVVTTAHQSFNPENILRDSKLVIDTRNLMRGRTASHLVRL